ncbi:hypothetical protein CY35_13G066400 [Sphagnum magellanicum]|nr:hypothetical protein CY35_13G066400 [Sphagnum magellanicum]
MDRRQLGSIPSIPTTVTVRLVLVTLTLQSFIPGIGAARTFTFANGCSSDVWVGTQPNGGIPILAEGGFALAAGETTSLVAEEGWGGRFWGRTGCTFDADGIGSCETGDCGGLLRCAGAGGDPPASLAEFTLNGANGDDFYDVSLVDGYNLEIRISPSGGNGTCGSPGCTSNLNPQCPEALQVLSGGTVVACKSACAAFGSPQYCCTDAYGSPTTCPPTTYSKVFKSACPTAYSYAYDDASSTFTCTGADYKISFCTSGSPSSSGGGGGSQSPPPPGTGILSPPSSSAAEKLVQSLITHMLNSFICATAIISLLIQ